MGFSGFNGSTSSIASSTDVSLNNASTGQALVYDTSLSKWKNDSVSKPLFVNVKDFGAKGDLLDYAKVTISGASRKTLTVTDAGNGIAFDASTVGKKVQFVDKDAPDGTNKYVFTTVASVTNATTLQLTNAASTTYAEIKAWIGTDDTAAMAASIASLSSYGGTVFFPTGNYLGYLDVTTRTRILGTGYSSTIMLPAGAERAVIGVASDSTQFVEIESIAIDGSRSMQTTTDGHGIYLSTLFAQGAPGGRGRITNVLISNCSGDGLSLAGSAGSYDVQHVFTRYNSGNGFRVQVPDSMFTNCDAGQSGLSGWVVLSGNNRFTACNAWFSGRVTDSDGWYVNSTHRIILTGCQAQDNARAGFRLQNATQITLLNCLADSNGSKGSGVSSSSSGSGFYLKNVTNSRISGVAFDRFPAAPTEDVPNPPGPTQDYALDMFTEDDHSQTSTGNQIDITDSNNRIRSFNGTWGSNNGRVGTDFYGLVANNHSTASSANIGSISGKTEIFDHAGNSLGFVALYS